MSRWKLFRGARLDPYDPMTVILPTKGHHPFRGSEERAHPHRDFIRANWENFAAAAWQGYHTQGRGCLIFKEEEFLRRPRGVPVLMRQLYLGEHGSDFQARLKGHLTAHGWPDDYIAQAVHDYDPTKEVLVLIVLPDNSTVFHRIRRGFIDPPQARYRDVQAN
jgi:hypothetical protein